MISVALCRPALSLGLAAAFLAGCGGSQTGGTMPKDNATLSQVKKDGHSRMLPKATSADLIYATGGCGGTCVISYPSGALVQSLSTSGTADCSDADGNVFIADDTAVIEYAHGGATPIETLNLPGDSANGCSVDPLTNNLAVVFRGGGVNVAVFTNEQGSPVLYNSGVASLYCGYDDRSNLFVDGYAPYEHPGLSELKAGSNNFTPLTVNESVGAPGQVQWDGSRITYEDGQKKGHVRISRLRIVGKTARIVGTTHLKRITGRASQTWIYAGKVFVPFGTSGERQFMPKVGVWNYPKSGNPVQEFTGFTGGPDFQGVTVSVEP